MHRQQAHTSIERNGRKRERVKTFFFEFFCSKVQTKYKKHRSQMKTPKKKENKYTINCENRRMRIKIYENH